MTNAEVLKALEKQQAKKPTKHQGVIYCPECYSKEIEKKYKHCPECGQRLDWQAMDFVDCLEAKQ